MIKFCWRSRSQIWIQICIATLVRRALAEVCSVPLLLVLYSDAGDDGNGVVGVGHAARRRPLLCGLQEEQAVHKVVGRAGLVTRCSDDEAGC